MRDCKCETSKAMTSPDTKEPIRAKPVAAQRRRAFPGIPLGRWRGVAVSARWSVLFILGLLADILATSALPAARPGEATGAYWIAGLLTATVFLVTVLAHEFAHAVTARHYGMGVKGITLWALGGFTELDGESPTPRAEALVAVAGPATSIGLGAVSGVLAWWAGGSGLLGAALSWLAAISVLLGVFNLLPGAPLDGGRLMRALLWRHYHDRARASHVAARVGRVLGFVLIALGFLELLAAGSFAGLWIAFVGWFIVGAATAEEHAGQAEGLKGLRVDDVIAHSPTVLPEWWTVEQVLAQAPPDDAAARAFPLVDFEGRATGALTLRDLQRVPVGRRAETRLRDIVRARRVQPLLVSRKALLTEIALPMRQRGGIAVVVDDENHPIGVLTADDLTRAARSVEHDRRATAPHSI
jgi:Zn-dependent protease/CBS domain-containing protein